MRVHFFGQKGPLFRRAPDCAHNRGGAHSRSPPHVTAGYQPPRRAPRRPERLGSRGHSPILDALQKRPFLACSETHNYYFRRPFSKVGPATNRGTPLGHAYFLFGFFRSRPDDETRGRVPKKVEGRLQSLSFGVPPGPFREGFAPVGVPARDGSGTVGPPRGVPPALSGRTEPVGTPTCRKRAEFLDPCFTQV